MKECTKCKLTKDLSEFGGRTKNKDGLNTQCKPCVNLYYQTRYKDDPVRKARQIAHNKANVEALKLKRLEYYQDKRCVDCGNKDWRVFEFDHVNDDKLFNIADGIRQGFSWKRILQEISKCEIVCANCHRIRTWDRRQGAVAKSGKAPF